MSPNQLKCTQVTQDPNGTLVFKGVGSAWLGATADFFETFRSQNPQIPARLELQE
jgi:hypothetical protein